MKIGTGFNGTTAGKVYLTHSLNFDGELALVYCNNKLYMWKSDLPLGTLAVYDPQTLQFEGKVKLLCGDLISKPHAWGFNRNFPLMCHENNLYVIMLGIKEV